jgi:hypothetical protein
MKGLRLRLSATAGAILLLGTAATAQQSPTPPATPPPPAANPAPPAANATTPTPPATTTTPTPAPTPAGTAAPTPAPAETQLPPVQVIQKQAEPAPKAIQKAASKNAAPPPPAAPAAPVTPQVAGTGGIDSGTVLMSPLEGSGIPIGKFPGAVGRASAADIARSGTTFVPSIIQQTVPGAILEDLQGNGFQQNLQYRGFNSSPLNGIPQGLAVYQNGVRINESFGDIVNWDFLPDSAIEGITIVGANNFARLTELDNTGNFPEIDGAHVYERFNPMTGITYEITPKLTAYGGYAEANRAPTPAELACADPVNPCLIESFLTADPNLKQVVSRTFELGLRGKETYWNDGKLEWSAGLFHAMNFDDILPLAAPESGRGFFANVGDTLRQGVELGMRYTDKQLMVYANYALVDATIQTNVQLPAPNNPTAVPCNDAPDAQCANATKGDRLPGVPEHLFKTGMEYWFTPQIKGGFDVVVASNQIFYNDWANSNAPLAGYATVNVHGSYDVTKNVQIYGLIDNLFNAHYGLFGNYFSLDNANGAAAAAGLGSNFFTNPETIVPGAPLAAYGGVRIKF